MQRAKESVAGKVRNKSAKLIITKKFPEDYHVRKKYAELMTLMSPTLMPKYWLAYVCLGAPGQWKTLEHLNTGGINSVAVVSGAKADEMIRKASSRSGKRLIDANADVLNLCDDESTPMSLRKRQLAMTDGKREMILT